MFDIFLTKTKMKEICNFTIITLEHLIAWGLWPADDSCLLVLFLEPRHVITAVSTEQHFEARKRSSVLTRLWFSQKHTPPATCDPGSVWVLWTSCLLPSATAHYPPPPWWPSPRPCAPSGPRCGRGTTGAASCPLRSATSNQSSGIRRTPIFHFLKRDHICLILLEKNC